MMAAEAAVRAIIGTPSNRTYAMNEEFFHPLLQRLFVEQPYWCDPPGPVCTKFKWVFRVLPYGATSEWQFMAYCDEPGWKKKNGGSGWKSVSWRKAVRRYKFNIIDELREVANARISMITARHRQVHRFCEHEDCVAWSEHVHHCKMTRKQIITEAIGELGAEDLAAIQAQYDWWQDTPFMLPDEHKFIQRILDHHGPGTLRALCFKHHNDAHGHQTHSKRDPFNDLMRR